MLSKISNIKAIQIFQLFRFASVLSIGIILSKSGFSQEDIGSYETFLFLQYSFTFFWLSGIINTFLAKAADVENRPVLMFNTALLLSFFAMMAIVFLLLFNTFQIIASQYILLLLLYILLTIPTFLNEYILLLQQKNKALLIYGLAVLVLPIFFTIVFVYFFYAIKYVIISLLLVAALKICFLFYLLKRYAKAHISIMQQKEMFIKSIPLSLSYLFSGSSEVIDGFLVKKYFPEQFAMYRFGARELPLVMLLANAFSSVAITNVAKNIQQGLQTIKEQSNSLFSYLFPITIALMWASKYLFVWVFNINFAESAVIFNVYLLLIVSRLLFPQTVLNGLQKNNFLVISALLETILNVLASLYLMQDFGIVGIAMGTVVASLFDKLLLIGYVYYKLNIKPNNYIDIAQHLFYSGLLYIVFYLLHYDYLL